jgi:hypothetical protein
MLSFDSHEHHFDLQRVLKSHEQLMFMSTLELTTHSVEASKVTDSKKEGNARILQREIYLYEFKYPF